MRARDKIIADPLREFALVLSTGIDRVPNVIRIAVLFPPSLITRQTIVGISKVLQEEHSERGRPGVLLLHGRRPFMGSNSAPPFPALVITAPIFVVASRSGSSAKCAYFCVVRTWTWPSSRPMIGSESPPPAPMDA